MKLELSLFGPFSAELDARPLNLRSKRGQALLALVLMSEGQKLSRDKIAALLWPDRAEAQARASLRQELNTLRKGLEAASDIIHADGTMVSTIDSPKIETLVDALSLQTDETSHQNYGEFLQGLDFGSEPFETWRAETGRALDTRRIALAERAVEFARRSKDPKALMAASNALQALDPWSETAVAGVMQAHVLNGHEAKALTHYATFEDRLSIEMHTKPGSVLNAVKTEILQQKIVTEPAERDLFHRPAILLLPVEVLSTDREDSLMARGLAEDLRTTLAYWRWFPVIGPEAADPGVGADLHARASSVGAEYALSTSFRRADQRVRITASLVRVSDGVTLWTEPFDGTLEDIFTFQEEISHAVVARLEPEIRQAEIQRIGRTRPSDKQAWHFVVEADEIERGGGPGYGTIKSNMDQLPLLEQATECEPEYAQAWAKMGKAHFRLSVIGPAKEQSNRYKCVDYYTRKALDIDPTEWEAHAVRAVWATIGEHDHQTGMYHGREAARLNPSAPSAQHSAACVLGWAGELHETLQHLELIQRLNPRYPAMAVAVIDRALAQFLLGRKQQALASTREMVAMAPRFLRGLQRAVAIFGSFEETEAAAQALNRVQDLQPDFSLAYVEDTYPFAQEAHLEAFISGLKTAGVPAT